MGIGLIRPQRPKIKRPSLLSRIASSPFADGLRYSNLAESFRSRSSAKRVRSNIQRRRGEPAKKAPRLKRRR